MGSYDYEHSSKAKHVPLGQWLGDCTVRATRFSCGGTWSLRIVGLCSSYLTYNFLECVGSGEIRGSTEHTFIKGKLEKNGQIGFTEYSTTGKTHKPVSWSTAVGKGDIMQGISHLASGSKIQWTAKRQKEHFVVGQRVLVGQWQGVVNSIRGTQVKVQLDSQTEIKTFHTKDLHCPEEVVPKEPVFSGLFEIKLKLCAVSMDEREGWLWSWDCGIRIAPDHESYLVMVENAATNNDYVHFGATDLGPTGCYIFNGNESSKPRWAQKSGGGVIRWHASRKQWLIDCYGYNLYYNEDQTQIPPMTLMSRSVWKAGKYGLGRLLPIVSIYTSDGTPVGIDTNSRTENVVGAPLQPHEKLNVGDRVAVKEEFLPDEWQELMILFEEEFLSDGKSKTRLVVGLEGTIYTEPLSMDLGSALISFDDANIKKQMCVKPANCQKIQRVQMTVGQQVVVARSFNVLGVEGNVTLAGGTSGLIAGVHKYFIKVQFEGYSDVKYVFSFNYGKLRFSQQKDLPEVMFDTDEGDGRPLRSRRRPNTATAQAKKELQSMGFTDHQIYVAFKNLPQDSKSDAIVEYIFANQATIAATQNFYPSGHPGIQYV